MFKEFEMAPPDAILGLTEAFKSDPNPNKINLGVGVYKDESGTTPTLSAVKKAEAILLDTEATKSYLSIPGNEAYGAAVRAMLFGADSALLSANRACTAHTPGGTGALRVAGDFIKVMLPGASLWRSDPTWANHDAVFGAAGVGVKVYPYYDADTKSLDFDAMTAALREIPEGDVVLLHGCCHNPTGVDLSLDQWKEVASILAEQKLLPLIDFAYQGFGEGLEEDAAGLRAVADAVPELMVASSYSKNFGLYRERTGALTVVGETADAAAKAFSHIKKRIRSNYSNPPAHGGLIVETILGDAGLRAEWEAELTSMRDRINGMRTAFVDTLKAKGVDRDFSFIKDQKGMFSFSGLNKDQVQKLRDDYAIYIVGSGRINVAGMTPGNMDALCEAIAAVL